MDIIIIIYHHRYPQTLELPLFRVTRVTTNWVFLGFINQKLIALLTRHLKNKFFVENILNHKNTL